MTAQKGTVAVVGTGDMGHAVGGALVRAGYRVVTAGTGRSALSRQLAAKSGIEDLESLEAVMRSAQLVLSIVPPAAAPSFAASAAQAMQAAGAWPVFADCNAVAPATVAAIARARRARRRAVRRRRHRRPRAGPRRRAHALLRLGRSARGRARPRRRGACARRPRRGDWHGIGDENGLFGAEQRHGCAADRGAAGRASGSGCARRSCASSSRAKPRR